ncbi:4-hydroxy-tetrahydrodipicolinate synthase [Bacteriovoracaceae bacterium]|nr:4-hydroxy-tetrahydrodipicolinate synthase [Bacteriovoracaceae bacterium]
MTIENLNNTKLWTALITPFNPDFTVDFDSFKKVIDNNESAGNGHLVLGSTGEALNISKENKQKIIEYVFSLNLKNPIMIGVGGHDLEETLNWINFLNNFDQAGCYLLVTPLYAKPGKEGQTNWFKTLMDRAEKPCMLYNVPGRTACELNLQTVRELKNHPRYWAIKEASGSVEKFKQYLEASDNKPVFCGDDGLMNDFAAAGASGLISVAGNCWPSETHAYANACLDQSLDNIGLWKEASGSLFFASNPVPAKFLLYKEGTISHPTVLPPLSQNDMTNLEKVLEYSTRIKQWNK